MVSEGSASSEISRYKSQFESGKTWLINLCVTLLVKNMVVLCKLTARRPGFACVRECTRVSKKLGNLIINYTESSL